MKPMNLLFIMSDQHSKEKYGAYGNPYIHTPNLDSLCRNGVRFNNAYCNNPICVPSRASMTTGDYGFKNSFWDNSHPYDGMVDGWGHRLSEQGHSVTTIGKLHYKDDSIQTGFADQRIPLHLKDGVGNLTVCIRDEDLRRPNQREVLLNAGVGDSDYLQYDAKVAKLAADFLKNEAAAKGGKPFCLYVGFVTPHFPLTVPERIFNMYDQDNLPFPKQWQLEEMPMHPAIDRFRQIACTSEKSVTEAVVRKAVACYYSLVTYMDEQVGIILKALKESGLEENTRIIYTSDHGDTMGDHGVFFKNTMYEGSVGVPLVVAGPDIPKGRTVEQCVSLLDIFPSVLDCVGAEPTMADKELPGTSLWKFAQGELEVERPIFAESHTFAYKHAVFMLRYKQYKLVYYIEFRPQLFDLENDPDELVDLAEKEEYFSVLDELKKRLFKICDPVQIDKQALKEQKMLLDRYGGKEAVMGSMKKYYFSYSPVPKGVL